MKRLSRAAAPKRWANGVAQHAHRLRTASRRRPGSAAASSRSMPVYCEPWPGKRTASLPRRLGAHAVMNAGRQRPGVAAEAGQRQAELGHQVGRVLGDDRDRLAVGGSSALARLAARSRSVDAGVALERPRAGRRAAPASAARVGIAPEQQLGGPAFGRRRPTALPELAAVLFHHDVEVGAAEAEGADGGAARHVAGLEPGHRLVEQVERARRRRQDRHSACRRRGAAAARDGAAPAPP